MVEEVEVTTPTTEYVETTSASSKTFSSWFKQTFVQMKPYLWLILAIYYIIVVFGMNDGGFGIIVPSIKAYYNISDGIVSLLLMCNTAGALASAFLNGTIVALLGQKTSIAIGLCCQTLAYLLLLWRAPFPAQCCFMVILGFGLGLLNAGVNVVCATMPHATIVLNLLHAIYGLGALLGPLIASGLLARGRTWNFFYVSQLCFVSSVVVVVSIVFRFRPGPDSNTETHKRRFKLWRSKNGGAEPEIAMSGRSTAAALNPPTSSLFRSAVRIPLTIIGAFYLLLYVGLEVSLGTWTYTYLTEWKHGDPIPMAHTVSGYWAGLMVGRILLGWFTARFGERRMVFLYLVVIVAGTILLWLVNNLIADGVVLFFTGFVLGPLYPTTVAVASKFVPSHLFATSMGFMAAFGSGGGALFPWIIGIMANRFGIWVMMPFLLSMTVGMIVLWASIPKKKPVVEKRPQRDEEMPRDDVELDNEA